MLAELFGVYMFLKLISASLIDGIQAKLFLIDLAKTLFRVNGIYNKNTTAQYGVDLDLRTRPTLFRKITIKTLDAIFVCLCSYKKVNEDQRKQKKLLAISESKIEKALDIRTIIKHQRAFSSLIRL